MLKQCTFVVLAFAGILLLSAPTYAEETTAHQQQPVQDQNQDQSSADSLWSRGLRFYNDHAPSGEQVRSYAMGVVDKLQKGKLPVCLKLDKVQVPTAAQLKAELSHGAKKLYYKTPLPQLVKYVSDNTPKALKTYVEDLKQLSLKLVEDFKRSDPPVQQMKVFAHDVYEAALVFSKDVRDATPTPELKQYGQKVLEASITLKAKLAMGFPAAVLKQIVAEDAQKLGAALGEYSSKLPVDQARDYAKQVFAGFWNNQVRQAAAEQQPGEAPAPVQNTDEPKLDQYLAEVSQASEELHAEVSAHPDSNTTAQLRQFAAEVRAAAAEFGANLKSNLPQEALKTYADKVWTATKQFVATTADKAPKSALLWWATKVAAAGAKFIGSVVWKTPGKMAAFSKPMYLVSALKQAGLKNAIPTAIQLAKTTAVDYVSAAWRLTHSIYVKIHLDSLKSTFEELPADQWASFLKAKTEDIRKGAIQLYSKYQPQSGTVVLAAARYVSDVFNCLNENGNFEKPKQMMENIANSAAKYVPAPILEYWRTAKPLEEWETIGLNPEELSGMY